MERRTTKKIIIGLLFGISMFSSADDKSKITGAKNSNVSTPEMVLFEEDWILVPTEPTSNLQIVDFKKNNSTLTLDQKAKLRAAIVALR